MNFRNILVILMFSLLVSCGKKDSNEGCEEQDSSSILDGKSYDCPSGNPSPSDMVVEKVITEFEAGTEYQKLIDIKNNGKAKIYDFSVSTSSDITVVNNACPSRLGKGESCSIGIKITQNLSNAYSGKIILKDRTNLINQEIPLKYTVKASYPSSVEYTNTEVDYSTQKIEIVSLKDRFGNFVSDNLQLTTNRLISTTSTLPMMNNSLNVPLNNLGSTTFFVHTNALDGSVPFDNADVLVIGSRVYANSTIISKSINLSFINNKPTISTADQNFVVIQNSFGNELSDLKEGVDRKKRPLTYKVVSLPQSGVLSNCLKNDTEFYTLKNCSYSPNKNFHGDDSFTYRVNNGIADSVEVATVKIKVTAVNQPPYLPLNGQLSFDTLTGTPISVSILPAFDAESDALTYVIVSHTTHGTITCVSTNCLYTPTNGYVGADFFTYKAIDPGLLESSIYKINFNVKQKNEAPILGGSENLSTIEDTPISFTLTAATDPNNDALVYKIKNPPTKGVLKNCLNSDLDLNCEYIPNKYENTADVFSYVAVDSLGLESSPRVVTITIAQVNSAPYYSNLYQEEQVLPNGSLNFVLLSAVDPENNTINYLQTQNLNSGEGSLSGCLVGNNLNCTYTAPSGVTNGSYVFKYRAQDSLGSNSLERTVKLIVKTTNNNPTLGSNPTIMTQEDVSVDFALQSGLDTETPTEFLKYKLGTLIPSKGVLKNCMDQSGSNGLSDISCTYVPNSNSSGTDSFSYYAIDGRNNQSNVVIVNIIISDVNDAPLFATKEMSFNVDEDSSAIINILKAIDPENDTITYSIKPGFNFTHGNINVACLSNLIATSIDCTYTATDLNYYGIDSAIIVATDSIGASSEIKIIMNINPINDAPVFANTSYTFSVLEDSNNDILIPDAVDIDTSIDLINYTIVTLPTKGILSGCLGINGLKGQLCKYYTKSNSLSPDVFTIKANDGVADSAIISINLNVIATNDAPYFEKTKIGPFKVENGIPFQFALNKAFDIESSPLTYSIVNQPANGVISNCFSGTGFYCTYTANENFIGYDSFTYQASDSINSMNTVQVDFYVSDKKYYRIYKLDASNNVNLAQRQLLSTDKNVYKLGDNYFYNAAEASNNYLANSLYYHKANGVASKILTYQSVNYKNVMLNDKLYVFDESVDGYRIRIVNQNGQIENSISYKMDKNLFYPKVFNNNIYVGSNVSSLYRVNLTSLGQQNFSWVEPIVNRSMLGISSGNKLIETIGVYKDELYFYYYDDSNNKKIAKIDNKDNLTLVSLNVAGSVSDFHYYKSLDGSVEKIYFISGSVSKKMYSYNLLVTAGNRINEITTLSQVQSYIKYISNLSIDGNDTSIYYDATNKRIVGLIPGSDTLVQYDAMSIENVIVSEDKTSLLAINSLGDVFKTIQDPIYGIPVLEGFQASKILKGKEDNFIIQNKTENNYYVLDTNNVLNPIVIDSSFVLSDSVVYESGSDRFIYGLKNSNNGIVYDLYKFGDTLSYNINKGQKNTLYGLKMQQTFTSFEIVSNPSHGYLDKCMGVGATSQIYNCEYIPDIGFSGQDSFKYKINIGSQVKNYEVILKVNNDSPTVNANETLSRLFTVSNIKAQINNYIVHKDEMLFSAKKENSGVLYLYNNAESVKNLATTTGYFDYFKAKSGFIYFVDKKQSNVIKYYDLASKSIVDLYTDTSSSFIVNDLVIVDNNLYALSKNIGAANISRILKINLSDYSTQLIPVSSDYDAGKFINLGNSFGIESINKFAVYDMTSQSFVDTTSIPNQNVVGYTQRFEDYLVFKTLKVESLYTSTIFKYYSLTSKSFEKESTFSLLGYNLESYIIKRLNGGSTPIALVESFDVSRNLNSIYIHRQGFSSDLSSSSSSYFGNTDYTYSQSIKNYDENVYYISRNEDWSQISFFKIGKTTNYYALNNIATEIKVNYGIDKNEDILKYELVSSPSHGVLSGCFGLGGSADTSINCQYTYTDINSNAIIDSFSYRAFDGYNYSLTKTISINIKNTPPYFIDNNLQSMTISKGVPTTINLKSAYDSDGNPIYYLITGLPTKGILSNCATSLALISQSSQACSYLSNSGSSGSDILKYRAFDGLSYSEELTINITLSNDLSPVFLNESQNVFVPKVSSYVITLDRAFDPQGLELTYQIINNPTKGSLSNCFVVTNTKLQCTYTPNNSAIKESDIFTYRATNGSYTSAAKTVVILITGSAMTGSLGSFHLTEAGPVLVKDGLNQISQLSTLPGYHWDVTGKTLILPANREYQFESIITDTGTSIVFRPFSSAGDAISQHGWTKIYSQSSCIIDGSINVSGGQTIGTVQSIVDVGIDNENLSYTIPAYLLSSYGGKSGQHSTAIKAEGSYGNPTLFQAGAGQASNGVDTLGGVRGKDGLGLFLKCVDQFKGLGSISVMGDKGQDGISGSNGLSDNVNISYGGSGGSGGGNGGSGGMIKIKTDLYNFSGNLRYSGGSSGVGGIGGDPNLQYTSPFTATKGTDGQIGTAGVFGSCFVGQLVGLYNACN